MARFAFENRGSYSSLFSPPFSPSGLTPKAPEVPADVDASAASSARSSLLPDAVDEDMECLDLCRFLAYFLDEASPDAPSDKLAEEALRDKPDDKFLGSWRKEEEDEPDWKD